MATYSNLNDYYTQGQGIALPDLSVRGSIYQGFGLGDSSTYTGSLDQNTALLGKLQAPTSITSATLAQQPAITNPTYTDPLQPSTAPPPNPLQQQLDASVSSAQTTYDQSLRDFQSALTQQAQEPVREQQLSDSSGLTAGNQRLSELNAIDTSFANDLSSIASQNLQGTLAQQGTATSEYGRQVNLKDLNYNTIAAQQNINIKRALNSTQIALQQGQVQNAQNYVQRALDLEFKPLAAKIQYLQAFLDKNKIALNQAEQNQLQYKIQQQTQEYQQGLADKKSIYDVLTTAAQNGADSATMQKIQNAQTPNDAIMAAGKYLRDPAALLDIQYKKAQIQKINGEVAAAVANDSAVSPETLQGMLNVYQSTGVLPAFGLSAKSPLRAQFYAALGSNGQIVTEANTNKAIRAGLTTAYKTQQNQYSAAQTAVSTLEKQLALAQNYSGEVDRTGSPLVNRYLLNLKSGVFGDPETAALNNIVTTASYELAKILSGSSASIAGATVSSQEDAKNLLNSAMSKGQFTTVLDLMRKEAAFRLQSQQDTLTQLESDLGNIGSLSGTLSGTDTSSSTSSLSSGLTSIFDSLFKQYGG